MAHLALAAALALAAVPAAAATAGSPAWLRAEAPGFVIWSEAGRDRTEELALALASLEATLRGLAAPAAVDPPPPLEVFLFRDRGSLAPYLPGSEGEARLSGFYLAHPHLDLIAVDGDPALDSRGLLFHEYLHAFLRHHLPHAPLWLNEGLAELYRTFRVDDGSVEVGRPIPEHAAWLRRHAFGPLSTLLATGSASPDYTDPSLRAGFYARAWALVHYLVTSDREVRAGFDAYLSTLSRSLEPASPLAALGVTAATLETRVADHIRGAELPILIDTAAPPAPELVIAAVAPAERWFRLGWLLVHQQPPQAGEAKSHFEAALALDPRHAGGHLGLGYLAALAGDTGAAVRYYDRAEGLGWDGYLLPYLRGRARFAPGDEAATLAARRDFRTAVDRRPSFAEAWAALGATWVAAAEPTAEGRRALEVAYRRLPTRPDVIYNLILLTARLGSTEEARSLLEPLSIWADPGWVERAERALEEAAR